MAHPNFPLAHQFAKAKLRAALASDWEGTDAELDACVERLYSTARALGEAMERGARPAHPDTMIGRRTPTDTDRDER